MKYKQDSFLKVPVPARYNTVVKANTLIQNSRFSLSTQQQKIILYVISQIEKCDEQFKLYEFKIADFCRLCGLEPQGNNYSFLKNAVKDISDKSLWITLDNGKETLVRWIEKPYIDENSGTIQIKLDEDMKPYLLQLKEKFTEYELIYTLNFKSKYSIRLYEFLKSIHYDKREDYRQTMPIEKFQSLLDSPYTTFKDFHTRVLKPAQKEINTFSDILFSYEIEMSGRKATTITIKIEPKNIVAAAVHIPEMNERILDKKGK